MRRKRLHAIFRLYKVATSVLGPPLPVHRVQNTKFTGNNKARNAYSALEGGTEFQMHLESTQSSRSTRAFHPLEVGALSTVTLAVG